MRDWRLFEEEGCGDLSQKQVIDNCKHASIACTHPLDEEPCLNTIFSPGDISEENIMVNQKYEFVGFRDVSAGGFVPRRWL